MKHVEALTALQACSEAVEYAATHESLVAAWNGCERGDWMLWYAGKMSGEPDSESRRKLVFVAAQCARLTLPYTKDPRTSACIETCERYSRGEATLQEVRQARYGAADAAAADAAAAARSATLKACADIVREHYQKPPRALKGAGE